MCGVWQLASDGCCLGLVEAPFYQDLRNQGMHDGNEVDGVSE